MKVHSQKESLNPHAVKLALPALNISQSSFSQQRKIQRSSSFASGALLDDFQRILANTSQRVLEGKKIVKENDRNEPKERNGKILILKRNELKEVLKNSSERKPFEKEEVKNKTNMRRSRSIHRLKEELTNQTFEKSPEPYLQDAIEETPLVKSERNLPTLLTSSGAPQGKKLIIPCRKPVRIFQNEELQKRIMGNYYLKNTITEVDSDSDSSVPSVLSPVGERERLWEKSGSSQFHMKSLLVEQPRCVTERSESPQKENSGEYKRQNGLFVLGNKSYQFIKTTKKPKSILVGAKKNQNMRNRVSETCSEIKRVRAKSIPSRHLL